MGSVELPYEDQEEELAAFIRQSSGIRSSGRRASPRDLKPQEESAPVSQGARYLALMRHLETIRPRCVGPHETMESAQRYAGKVELAEYLRANFGG